jgi:hypothetical protein
MGLMFCWILSNSGLCLTGLSLISFLHQIRSFKLIKKDQLLGNPLFREQFLAGLHHGGIKNVITEPAKTIFPNITPQTIPIIAIQKGVVGGRLRAKMRPETKTAELIGFP